MKMVSLKAYMLSRLLYDHPCSFISHLLPYTDDRLCMYVYHILYYPYCVMFSSAMFTLVLLDKAVGIVIVSHGGLAMHINCFISIMILV